MKIKLRMMALQKKKENKKGKKREQGVILSKILINNKVKIEDK